MADGSRFIDEFIDDYFSECEEHLATVRRVLLSLESAEPGFDAGAALHELSRALHTLKGLSGMVGLAPAESAAHAMEDCVRFVAARGTPDGPVLEALFNGERLLESAVAARRAGTEPPSAAPFVEHVHDLISGARHDEVTVTAEVEIVDSVPARTALQAGPAERHFEFIPSAALANRGIGVELIRRRLAELGTITTTTPRVRPTGGVAFDFVIAMRDPAFVPPAEWRDDGLSWELAESPETVGLVLHGASAPTETPAALASATSNMVRVDLTRLDDLMRLVGELVVTRARLADALDRVGQNLSPAALDELSAANDTIDRQLRSMREGVMRVRLVPVGEVFERMRFAMRDIAREAGKSIRLEASGQDTEIDKLVVDRLLEPLLHLVRNAASHGIESRDERIARGKPVEGTIALRARASGDRILIEVEDDGAGVDIERVSRRARDLGLASAGEVVSPDAILDVICAAGFSTRDAADMASGRGVGMGVVRSTIRALAGELFIDSVHGRGTRFTIELPLTLMITDALIVCVGDQTMAIPHIALREIVPLDDDAVTRFENNEVLSYRGRVIPLLNLADMFRLPPSARLRRHVLVVGNDSQLAGLVADDVIGLREIVVHPVADPFVAVPGIAGATELANGRVSLILDASALIRRGRTGAPTMAAATSTQTTERPWS